MSGRSLYSLDTWIVPSRRGPFRSQKFEIRYVCTRSCYQSAVTLSSSLPQADSTQLLSKAGRMLAASTSQSRRGTFSDCPRRGNHLKSTLDSLLIASPSHVWYYLLRRPSQQSPVAVPISFGSSAMAAACLACSVLMTLTCFQRMCKAFHSCLQGAMTPCKTSALPTGLTPASPIQM